MPLEECIFLRDLPRSQRPMNRRPPRTTAASQLVANHELFARIEKLENLLSASGRRVDENQNLVATATTPEQPLSSSSFSTPNQYGQPSPLTDIANHRKLTTTTSGHQRYEPFPASASHLGEAVAGAAASSIETPGSSRRFPFASTTSPMSELLATLPSLRHCDALKDLYFRVFGSVSEIVRRVLTVASKLNVSSCSTFSMTRPSRRIMLHFARILRALRFPGWLYCIQF